jgi:hypothetical protein
MTSTPNFGDVVDSSSPATQEQLDRRQYGFSTVSYEGSPTVYKGGDVVYLPYESNEPSSMEAVGLAWAAYAEGILPDDT